MMNSTNKILVAAVVLLLLINAGLLYFLLRDKGHGNRDRDRGKGAYEKMKKELNMTPEQMARYDSLREMHFATIRPIFDSMRASRQALFGLMKAESLDDSLVNIYSARITEKQTRADRLTLEHFRRVRKLFSGDQQQKFDEFVQKMMQGRKKQNGRKPEPAKK